MFGLGGGANFLGIWGGPGGRNWGNVFAGGGWLHDVARDIRSQLESEKDPDLAAYFAYLKAHK